MTAEVNRADTLVFATKTIVSSDPYRPPFQAAALHSHPDALPLEPAKILVDNEPLQIDESTVRAIAQRVLQCADIERQGFIVDSNVFAIMLAGGQVEPLNPADFAPHTRSLQFRISLQHPMANSVADLLPWPTTPGLLAMGDSDYGQIYPTHLAVGLPESQHRAISRIGKNIAITDVASLMRTFRASRLGFVERLQVKKADRTVATYSRSA